MVSEFTETHVRHYLDIGVLHNSEMSWGFRLEENVEDCS